MAEPNSSDRFAKFMSHVRTFNDFSTGLRNVALGVGAVILVFTVVVLPNWKAFVSAGLYLIVALPHMPLGWLKNRYARIAWGVGVFLAPFIAVFGVVGIAFGITNLVHLEYLEQFPGSEAQKNVAAQITVNSALVTVLSLWGIQQPAFVIANERLDRLESAFLKIAEAVLERSGSQDADSQQA